MISRKTRAVGPHKSFIDAYAAAADVTDHLPADSFLVALIGVPAGTLSGCRAKLKERGYDFHSRLVRGINGENERVYQVISRPAPPAPPAPVPVAIVTPVPEPAPAKPAEENSVLREIAMGLAGLDPDDLSALRDLIVGAHKNGNGNGK